MTKTSVDWEAVERDYRIGILTLREIAGRHGITHAAVNKRAKRDGWSRDLAAKVRAKAEELVSKAVVSKEVSTARQVSEREAVEVGAAVLAQIKMGQREGLSELLREREELLKELVFQRENLPALENLAEILVEQESTPAGAQELRRSFNRALGLGNRAAILKSLAEIDAKLIPLQSTVWGMDEKQKDPSELDDLSDEELDKRIEARMARLNAAAAAQS